MEASLQGQELLLNAHPKSPLDVEPGNGTEKLPSNRGALATRDSPHVLLLVFVGHRSVFAVGLQVVVGDLTESVVFHCKGGVYVAFNVVFPINAHHTHSASLGG